MKVQYIVKNYPQLSQTYIKSELKAVMQNHEVSIIATSTPNVKDSEALEFQQVSEEEEIIRQVEAFQPDIIHSHYLVLAELISRVSLKTGVPFTIRAHSFDALKNNLNNKIPAHIENLARYLNTDLCKGVLIFPFTRDLLVAEGKVDSSKLVDTVPVVDVNAFYNESQNGDFIMNTGACIPKKEMQTFVKLSQLLPEQTFNLYGLGHDIDKIYKLNQEIGGSVNFIPPVPYSQMPREYKKHKSMVYTANMDIKTVGWPMAALEAMASGTMVYMPRIRPDIENYIGDAGYVYENIEEIADQLKRPVDNEKRQYAFEYAKKYDIIKHISTLTELW